MKLFARDALLPSGWVRDVVIGIGNDGVIESVDVAFAEPTDAERVQGPLLPGMPNAHSHAFQRALAGLTERGGPAHDDFWSWRTAMYRFLQHIGPDEHEAISSQVYLEMLRAGYTSVAEFHYLHHDPAGHPYANRGEMAERTIAAAEGSGIGLALLPVFYAHAGFGGMPPTPAQQRFVQDIDEFTAMVGMLADNLNGSITIGVAPHSLRAITPAELTALLAFADHELHGGPIHIHAAEQRKEVDDCIAWCGAGPLEWLLDHAGLDSRWCIVHGTHMTQAEATRVAASRAVIAVCPSTEADLGDGIFPADDYLRSGGRLAIGGDSHVAVDPLIELRLLEISQRLKHARRNVLARDSESVGLRLYQLALAGGAQALARNAGAIAPGRRADLVVLDGESSALSGLPAAFLLDAAIFGPGHRIVRDVMVAGRWVIGDGHHADEESILIRYRQTMKRLLDSAP